MNDKRRPKLSRLHANAIHEAAHAVMAFHLDQKVKLVSVEPGVGFLGRVGFFALPKWLKPGRPLDGGTQRWIEDLILVALAGEIAETAATGKRDRARCDQDRRVGTDLARYVCLSDFELKRYLAWLDARAKALLKLPANESAVESISAKLVEAKLLSGNDAFDIWRKGVRCLMPVAFRRSTLTADLPKGQGAGTL